MEQVIACTHCQARFRLDLSRIPAGKRLKCSRCGQLFSVTPPVGEPSAAAEEPRVAPPAAVSPPGDPAARLELLEQRMAALLAGGGEWSALVDAVLQRGAAAASGESGSRWEVVDIDAKTVEVRERLVVVRWEASITNASDRARNSKVRILFLDEEGHVVDADTKGGIPVEPGAEALVSGYALLAPRDHQRIARFKALVSDAD
ncbi:MAG: zinc-ribbon domain-containing protein [Magnetococcus sp. WYHC-3]